MAVLPHPPQLPGEPTDKIQHVLAFTVLTALACAAWPAATRVRFRTSAVFCRSIPISRSSGKGEKPRVAASVSPVQR